MGKYRRVSYSTGRKPKWGLNIKTRFKSAKDKLKSGKSDAPVKAGYDNAWSGPGHLTVNPKEHLDLYQNILIPGEIQRDYNNTKEGRAQVRLMYQGDTWLRREASKRGIDWNARSSSKRRNQPEVKKLAREVGMPARTLVSALRKNWSSETAEEVVLRKRINVRGFEIKLGKQGTVIRKSQYDKLDGVMNDLDDMTRALQDLMK